MKKDVKLAEFVGEDLKINSERFLIYGMKLSGYLIKVGYWLMSFKPL
ncbi:MAG: hypothetical protein QN229_05535 [Desulfurococcaceae archaeon TW002]